MKRQYEAYMSSRIFQVFIVLLGPNCIKRSCTNDLGQIIPKSSIPKPAITTRNDHFYNKCKFVDKECVLTSECSKLESRYVYSILYTGSDCPRSLSFSITFMVFSDHFPPPTAITEIYYHTVNMQGQFIWMTALQFPQWKRGVGKSWCNFISNAHTG